MEIDPAVWEAWREEFEENGAESALTLALDSPVDPRALAGALNTALREVGAEFDKLAGRPELEYNPPLFGGWDWLRTPDGVIVTVYESDDFALGDDTAYSLDSGSFVRVPWRGDAFEQIFDAVDRRQRAWLVGAARGGGRRFAAEGSAGTLSAFGTRVTADAWQAELARLLAWLREHAGAITYARAVRGWSTWPRRAHDRPRGPGQTGEAFEDLWIPDAFGAQLLGPSFDGRVPSTSLWRTERLGAATLLVPAQPERWFAAGGAPRDLERARAQLAPLLYTQGAEAP